MKVAILGFGTIGQGVAKVLSDNKDRITELLGEEIVIQKILDRHDHSGSEFNHLITSDVEEIYSEDIDLCVEALGGVSDPYTYVEKMLGLGVSVATSNKALVCAYGPELFQIAEKSNSYLLFEGAVGGGIPIIRTLNESLGAEEIIKISGIMNGTSNFILSKMKEGLNFSDSLKLATEKGYAEKDPSDDIDGIDTARKLSILVSMASGKKCPYDSIETIGIRDFKEKSLDELFSEDMCIKLLGTAEKVDNKWIYKVSPVRIPNTHPFSNVNGVLNSFMVETNSLGVSFYTGEGAGGEATASAVVSDLIELAKAKKFGYKISQRKWTDD
ncbi:MAG: homoserine dehydrogenase [Lachnospiraceae bacterium]|nr:homoserine dehydrogenase [Lachnospiraceae bacterium]